LFDLLGNGGQVSVDLIFEQAALLGIESFELGGELHALQERVLKSQLLVQCALVAQLRHEAGRHLAQLLCAQFGQGLLLHHHELHPPAPFLIRRTTCSMGLPKLPSYF
jgi:hypothetical protein